MFSFQVVLKMRLYFGEEEQLLFFVHIHHCFQYPEIVLRFLRRFYQRLHIFREAAAAITNAGEEEPFAYTVVAADAPAHHIHVSTELFAENGDLVHERYFGGEEG